MAAKTSDRVLAQEEPAEQLAVPSQGRTHANHVVDFLAGRTGLGPHVLVALHRCLTPSQVTRVVAAYRAGAPLARELDVHGRSPREILADSHFAWSSPMRVAA